MTDLARALISEAAEALGAGASNVAVIGLGSEALEVAVALRDLGGNVAIFDPRPERAGDPRLTPWAQLAQRETHLVVIALDQEKEALLRAAAAVFDEADQLPDVVLSGLGHQDKVDPIFADLEAPALVPSYATGHPYTRAHLYDCLKSAAAGGREGAIVELGAFKGGTTVWLAKAAAALGLETCPVIGFDAWDGFPPRRSLLDLYEHPRCVFRDFDAVRRYTEPFGVELIAGDIADTAPQRLASVPVLLAFVDTDNYSGARSALDVIVQNLVPGGAIVLDHFHTTADYTYTVGERMAAEDILSGAGFLHLAGTGVFVNLA